jgi:tetratricopeptide (TPR) repeat protein
MPMKPEAASSVRGLPARYLLALQALEPPMRRALHLLTLGLVTAAALAAPAPPGGPAAAAAQPLPADVQEASDLLTRAAAEPDPARAKELADSALRRLEAMPPDTYDRCRVLYMAAEADIRAGRPVSARGRLEGAEATCPPGPVKHLRAWSLEYDDAGLRHGPTARLREAEEGYLEAARFLAVHDKGHATTLASALGGAAELAERRGDVGQCQARCQRALQAVTDDDRRRSLGLTYARCASAIVGEGQALEMLSQLVPKPLVIEVANGRMETIKRQLEQKADDAVSAAAMAYYTLVTPDAPQGPYFAMRYLLQALARDEKLPDAWYLLGRAHADLGSVEEAKSNYRRQMKDHPELAATRLAANALAQLIADHPASPVELTEALMIIDEELALTPDEAAMHDTRGSILLARHAEREALAAFERAYALGRDPAVKQRLDGLRAKLGVR